MPSTMHLQMWDYDSDWLNLYMHWGLQIKGSARPLAHASSHIEIPVLYWPLCLQSTLNTPTEEAGAGGLGAGKGALQVVPGVLTGFWDVNPWPSVTEKRSCWWTPSNPRRLGRVPVRDIRLGFRSLRPTSWGQAQGRGGTHHH
mmetsp:Transcript_16823/g.30088  ORF Transcript_16823/g.30088 Transcript_16823/m.30088 type:complete len:143 (-) Transcript_16823:1029-1457(-)